MSDTDNTTTPMPDFLPLDSSTATLTAVADVLRRLELRVEVAEVEAEDALEALGATFDEAFELVCPSGLGGSPGWNRDSVCDAIETELARRNGDRLPGLGE